MDNLEKVASYMIGTRSIKQRKRIIESLTLLQLSKIEAILEQ
jgi:hypothetical protein